MRKLFSFLFSFLVVSGLALFFSASSYATPYDAETTLSDRTLNPDGSTTYTLTSNIHVTPTYNHYGPPPSQVIVSQEALINQTGANAGQHRGHFRWSFTGSGLSAGRISCTCGNAGQCSPSPYPSSTSGFADIEPGAFGSQYVQLVSCTVWANGVTGQNFSGPANHITEWVFRALPLWGTSGPFVNNTVSSRATDQAGNSTSYVCQENTGSPCFTFNILNSTPSNITVTELTMTPDQRYAGVNGGLPPSSTLGYITMKVYDPDGGNDVRSAYVRINLHGLNAGQHRGYFGWSMQGFPGWSGNYYSGWVYSCTNGGQASTYNGFGANYIWPGNCTTSVSGNVRTIQIALNLNTSFSTPYLNTLSGWAMDAAGNTYNWAPFEIFTTVPRPTVATTINTSPVQTNGTTTYTVTQNANNFYGGAYFDYFYLGINSGPNSRGYGFWNPTQQFVGNPNVIKIPCSGAGGFFHYNTTAIAPENAYTNFLSCATTASDTTKRLTTTVSFNPIFTSPITNQLIGLASIGSVSAIATNGTFDIVPSISSANFTGKITDGSSCAAGAPAITFNASNNVYETQLPGTTAPINGSGNYTLNNVTLQPTNTFCTNLATPPGGGYYRLVCATSSSGTASISGNCANVTGATGPNVTVNLGYRIVTQTAWFQSLFGDVYTNCDGCSPSISRGLPDQDALSPYAVEPFMIDITSVATSSVGATGLAIAKGDIVAKDSLNNVRVSNDNKKGTDGSSSNYRNLQVLNYTSNGGGNIVSPKVVDFTNGPATATAVTTTSTPSCANFLTAQRVARVYKMNAACFSTMMGATPKTYDFSAGVGGGTTGVIYVTGASGITFTNRLTAVGNSRLVLVVEGPVTVDDTLGAAAITQSTVGDIQATIVSKGSITFEANGTQTDSSVVVDGSIITLADAARVNFARDRGLNNAYPGTLLRFKVKDLVDLTNLELTSTNISETGLFINDVRWSTQ